jgi:hypothetical protein
VGIYARYKYLYKGEVYELPPVIDASFVPPTDRGVPSPVVRGGGG